MEVINKTEEFIKRAKQVHGDKYDYSKVEYKNNKTKVCIICPEHGEFWQQPYHHLEGHECSKCMGSAKKTTEQFIQEAIKIHGDKYDYTKVEYINSHTKVCIICPEHGEFWQMPHHHLKGCNCPKCVNNNIKLTTKEFVQKARIIHGDKYDYSKVAYENMSTKVCIICPEHGEFWQQPVHHLEGHGCQKCSKIYNYTTEEFIQEARKIHGDKYDYSKVEYINSHTKVCIICPEHGEFWQQPGNHLHGQGCKQCLETQGERRIRVWLENHSINFIYNKACLKFLDKMKPDFYLPDYNLVIEYDGIQHFKNIKHFGGEKELIKRQQNDSLKNILCEQNNVNMLRIPYTEIDNIEKILEKKLK